MTGMKEGAGEDPFADEESEGDSTPSQEETPGRMDADADDESATASRDDPVLDRPDAGTATQQSGRNDETHTMQIPYKYRRDGVQDGRTRVPLFLQEETKRSEREVLRELENRFDEDVTLTDLREAAVKVGLQHSDDVAVQLRKWGYGITFDES